MKKALLLCILLALGLFFLTACGAPAPTEEPTEAPTEAPVITQAPVITAEPTISPRPMEGTVEWPEANATLLTIDPIDKPTRPPIVFEPYRTYVSTNLGVSFDIPEYFGEPTGEVPNTNMIVFMEPDTDIRSGTGYKTSVTIGVAQMSNEQTEKDAQTYLDVVLDSLRTEYPNMQTSSQASNSMMKQKGSYVTYWIDMPIDGDEENVFRMRGRCLVVPNGTNLYMVRFLCPSEFNGEYEESVFKVIRSTFDVI